MARKNPTLTTERKGLDDRDGIELPLASGKSSEALADGNKMPEVSMKTNDGDNPSIGSAPFANGKDGRVKDEQGGANPAPAMPGAR